MAEPAVVDTPEEGKREDRILGIIKQLQEGLDEKDKTTTEKFERFEKQMKDILAEQAEMQKQRALGGSGPVGGFVRNPFVKAGSPESKFDIKDFNGSPAQRSMLHEGVFTPSVGNDQSKEAIDLIAKLQEAGDAIYLAAQLSRVHQEKQWHGFPELKSLELYREYEAIDRELQRALNTETSGDGVDWIPTSLSAAMQAKVILQLKVAAQFDDFPMPSNPFHYPFMQARPVAQVVTESVTASNPYDGHEAARALANASGKTIFDAKKLRCLEVVTRELSDDSIPEAVRHLMMVIPQGIAEGREDAIINGDTEPNSGTGHIDSDIVESDLGGTSPKTLWDGLRKRVESIGAGAKQDLATLNTATLRSQRKKMGVYGVTPSRLRYFAGISSLFAMMNNADVLTLDKYGEKATVLQGELGKFDNIPIIVSEFIRQDLNDQGVYAAASAKTILMLCYTGVYKIGSRPSLGLESERMKVTDSELLVAFDRRDFQCLAPATDVHVSVGHNIPS